MCTPDDFMYFFGVVDELCSLWLRAKPTRINISTMTMMARAPAGLNVRLGMVRDMDELDYPHLLHVGRSHPDCPPGHLRVVHQKKRTRKEGQFGNQATLAYDSFSQRSIKIFSNGKFLMAGCKGLAEFDRVSRAVGGLLFGIGAINARLTMSTPEASMLNCNFDLGVEFSMTALWKLVVARFDMPVTWETDSHPALIVKFGFATAMIFRSGHVLVSSREQLSGLLRAFRLICGLVDDCCDDLRARVRLNNRAEHPVKHVLDGYPLGQILPCLPLPVMRHHPCTASV